MSPTPVVLSQRLDGHIGLVTLNRPEVRNAVNGELARALEAVVLELEADDQVWAVVLTGAGPGVFCAGADLKEVKPWIAAVNGKALAGGCEIVLACDLVVASDDAAFGLPEVSRGLIAAAGGLIRLPRALPRNLALELAMTGDPMDVRRAELHGLVNRVVPAGQVVDEAVALARRINRNAPVAVRESLQIARVAAELSEADARALTLAARERVMRSEDYKEGPRAFVEKREPRWTGR